MYVYVNQIFYLAVNFNLLYKICYIKEQKGNPVYKNITWVSVFY